MGPSPLQINEQLLDPAMEHIIGRNLSDYWMKNNPQKLEG